MTKIIITGSRRWYCIDLARRVIERLVAKYGDIQIIHGACEINGELAGVDAAFDHAAREIGLVPRPYPADWHGLGSSAGPRRNTQMVNAGADLAIAIHKNIAWSRGTKDCARKLIAANISTWLIDNEAGNLKRLNSKMLVSNYEMA